MCIIISSNFYRNSSFMNELLDIMGLAHLFNISIKLYGPYMYINGFIPYGNLIERRLYLNTWSLIDLFEK